MKRYLILFLLFFTACMEVLALEIVYPKTNPVKINAPSTFFIGSTTPPINAKDSLKINDIEVKVSPLGAFAQAVSLNFGINKFKITSTSNNITSETIFTIERPQPKISNGTKPVLSEYPVMNNFYIKDNNSPLRATPIDSGINRMSHLQEGTQVLVNGEKGDFYRVYLNSTLNGWVAKSNVEQKEIEDIKKSENKAVRFKKIKIKEENGFCVYEIELDKKTPFIVKEENGLILQLFNIEGQTDNTYTINIPSQNLTGYFADYEGEKFILKVRKLQQINQEKPLENIIIAVDAGHGGSEFGAIGCCGDKEKDINLIISKNLQAELESLGAKVVMTRESDVNVSLQDRVNFAKNRDATLLISIHANAIPDGSDPNKNRGTSVYYYHNQAKELADSILNSMTTQLKTQNDKVRQGSLALVRPTSSVSVLIEVAYIINPDDYALLLDKNFQVNCAKSIADGIKTYIINVGFKK